MADLTPETLRADAKQMRVNADFFRGENDRIADRYDRAADILDGIAASIDRNASLYWFDKDTLSTRYDHPLAAALIALGRQSKEGK